MLVILNLTKGSSIPVILDKVLDGRSFQPVDIDDILDEEDLEGLAEYLIEINADEIYVLMYDTTDSQALTAIRESDIEVKCYFSKTI